MLVAELGKNALCLSSSCVPIHSSHFMVLKPIVTKYFLPCWLILALGDFCVSVCLYVRSMTEWPVGNRLGLVYIPIGVWRSSWSFEVGRNPFWEIY